MTQETTTAYIPPWLSGMPSDWTVSTLDCCCRTIQDGDWIETKDQGGSSYRLLQISNIGTGSFRETGKYRYITDETFDRLRCTEILPGLILVSRMPDPVGRAWLVTAMPWRAVTVVDVAILEVDPTKLDAAFCAYYLNSPQNLAHAAAQASGTTRLRITRRNLAQFPIPKPPLPIQCKIAAILSTYDDLIENNTRRIKILEEMTQRIYCEWFVNFRYPGHEKAKFVDSPLGKIPEGWEVKKLGDACNIIMGQSPKSEFYNDRGNGLPFHQGVTNFGSHFPIHKTYCTVQKRLANIGDILFSVRAPVGRINLANSQIILGRGLCGIRNKEEYQCFTLFQLKDRFKKEDIIGGGTIFKSVTKDDMFNVAYVFPGEKLTGRFESLARPMVDEIENLTAKNANLHQTRDLLLPKLISGELDVSELDIETGKENT